MDNRGKRVVVGSVFKGQHLAHIAKDILDGGLGKNIKDAHVLSDRSILLLGKEGRSIVPSRLFESLVAVQKATVNAGETKGRWTSMKDPLIVDATDKVLRFLFHRWLGVDGRLGVRFVNVFRRLLEGLQ